jgi:hypothetical protein
MKWNKFRTISLEWRRWLPLPLVLTAVSLLGLFPGLVESLYSRGIYPYLSAAQRFLLGWIPFSVGDLLYTLLFLHVVRFLYRHLRQIRRPGKALSALRRSLNGMAMLIGAFYLLWGLNYYRVPLEDTLGIDVRYTDAELREFANYLTVKATELQLDLDHRDSLVRLPYNHRDIYSMTITGYTELRKEWPWARRNGGSIKGSLYSTPLSYMGYGGYLNPFTNEAQVNENVPIFSAPVLSGHEAGHQLGFAAEGDTNFIGQLVSIRNPDPYFRYSGYTSALRYVLAELQRRDPDAFQKIWDELPQGIKQQYRELRKYRMAYENPMSAYFESAFDAFLKINRQPQGIRSYSRVVGLLIGYHRSFDF